MRIIIGILAVLALGGGAQAGWPFYRDVTGGVNGGSDCVACSVVVALVEQLGIVYNETVDASLARLCNYLPQGMFRVACTDAVKQFGPIIISGLYAKETPDVICHAIGFCYTEKGQPECRMFPAPKNTIKFHSDALKEKLVAEGIEIPEGPPSICKTKAFEKICAYFERIFDTHEPGVDLDKDSHSTYTALRGTSWRGRDCNDLVRGVHPGAKPLGDDSLQDTNCNGIFGRPGDSDLSYEQKFCKNSQQMGVAILGDSLSAHFHLPEEWFDATTISEEAFKHVAFVIENEADWPQLSIYTGFMNTTWPIIEGTTNSIYLKMWERNRCNFRDYANVAVNGARTGSMLDIMKFLNRSQTNDQPLLLGYSLVGNDVCNGHPDTFDHMTKPDEFYNNVIQAMDYLDTVLPAGSHVFLTGLANGSVLYEAMGDQIYPIGRVKNDVKYSDMYTYLSCLQISPCNGWMTTNATVRQMTTDYAMMLSDLVKNVTLTRKYKNFDMLYLEFPLEQIFAQWEAMGGQVWQLIEPVDGFHMSQYAHAFGADAVWKIFMENRPEWLGPVNPFNDDISKIFGNQGGY